MTNMDETDAIKAIDKILLGIENSAARDRILLWAWDKFSSKSKPVQLQTPTQKTKSKSQLSTSRPSIVKDLNLRPSDKKSFKDFVAEKKPTSNDMKNTVIVFYLHRYLSIQKVSFNHVYTCYKEADWRIPADIANSLRQTYSRRGWIDPSDKDDIQLTALGENLVEHDLPKTEIKEK